MLTLIATCYLTGQLLFTVPADWRVTEVYAGGPRVLGETLSMVYCPPDCEAQRQKTYVKLVRDVQPRQIVEAPQGCTVLITFPEGKRD